MEAHRKTRPPLLHSHWLRGMRCGVALRWMRGARTPTDPNTGQLWRVCLSLSAICFGITVSTLGVCLTSGTGMEFGPHQPGLPRHARRQAFAMGRAKKTEISIQSQRRRLSLGIGKGPQFLSCPAVLCGNATRQADPLVSSSPSPETGAIPLVSSRTMID